MSLNRFCLCVRVLGGFGLCDDMPAFSLPKRARALLVYLAVENDRTVRRDELIELLWPDRGPDQGRHSLRQTLVELRQVTDQRQWIASADGGLKLDPEIVQTDLDRLRQLSGSATRADLVEVWQLYANGLVPDFPSISSAFDSWLAQARQAVRTRVNDALSRLVDGHLEDGDAAGAVRVAEQIVRLDPLREDGQRRLMLAYLRAGRRSDAIRQYAALKVQLLQELDVLPSAETDALLREAKALTAATLAAAGVPVPLVHAQARDGPPWVAVMPFRVISSDPIPSYIAMGVVDEIACMLAALHEPVIVSSNSTLGYSDRVVSPKLVAQELGVRYLISGAVRRLEQVMRVTVELTDAFSGQVIWAKAFDAPQHVFFEASSSIVAHITHSLAPQITDAELRRIRTKPPNSLDAYDLTLQARELILQLQPDAFARAGDLLRRAVVLGIGYASTHSAMADWHSLRVGQGWSPDPGQDAHAVDAAAERAISIDGSNARALATYGHNRSFLYRDYGAALDYFARALDAAPNDPVVWKYSSSTYSYVGDGKEAIRRAERALQLSPRDPFIYGFYSSLALGHHIENSFIEAVHWGKQAVQANPNYTSSLRVLAASLVALGRLDEARDYSKQLLRIQPQFRVQPLLEVSPIQDAERRELFGARLIEAGLPP